MAFLDAATYTNNNSLQKLDADFVLKNYFKYLRWHDQDSLIDVGTGDGSVLLDLLLPKLPNHGKVVALDMSKDMMEITRNNSKNRKIEYICMDIASRFIPQELHGFDHIFSFYCLNWVREPRLAMKNIFTMLKPGGDILLLFAVRHPIYDVFDRMAKMSRWAPFMNDVDKLFSPYLHYSNPAEKMGETLRDVGFVDVKCEVMERTFVHENSLDFKNWVMPLNPFLKRIPEEDLDDYKQDYVKEFLKLETIKSEDGKVLNTYQMMIVVAVKPEANAK